MSVAGDDRALFLARWYQLIRGLLARKAGQVQRSGELIAVLKTWRGRAEPADSAHRWIHEIRDTVHAKVFAGLLHKAYARYPQMTLRGLNQREGIVWQILSERPAHLLPRGFADWDSFLVAACNEATARVTRAKPGPLAERTWDERNGAVVAHPFSRAVPALGRFIDLPYSPVAGDAFMPRFHRRTHGASQRLVVRPGHEARGYFHMPGGQSGHPLSPFYAAGHRAWVDVEPTPLLPGAPQHTLVLSPE